MLEQQDFEAIGELVQRVVRSELVPVRQEIATLREELRQEIRQEIGLLRADINALLDDNIMPQFEYMHEQFDVMHKGFAGIRHELADMRRSARVVWAA